MNIYTTIAPTYLYIKQHSKTGLKYFGKTIKKDPIKYLGSGKRWKRHINKHGKQFVETIWLSDLYFDTSIVEHALHFSAENKIDTTPTIWANQKPENGLDGGGAGPISPETRKKLSDAHKGRIVSDETKEKMSATAKSMTPEHRKKLSDSAMGRKHSDKTKAKLSDSRKGTKMTQETKDKISASGKGRTRTDDSKEKMSAKFLTIIETKLSYSKGGLTRKYPEFKKYY